MTGVRVKALVWERDSLGWGWWADSILGSYRVFNGSRWRLCGCGDTQGTDAGNEDAAKGAAQADYETRILAALEPQDAPAMAEELVALRAALEDLRKSAALLQQNAEGCAVNHYGADFAVHGMPGWLADTAASIARATAALTPEAKS